LDQSAADDEKQENATVQSRPFGLNAFSAIVAAPPVTGPPKIAIHVILIHPIRDLTFRRLFYARRAVEKRPVSLVVLR